MRKFIVSLFVVSTIILSFVSKADSEIFTNNPSSGFMLDFSGSIPGQVFLHGDKVLLAADFNWSEPSMTISGVTLNSPLLIADGSATYTTGPGQYKTIRTEVTVSTFSYDIPSPGKFALIPSTSGNYTIFDHQRTLPSNDITLTGTYKISGPTETVTGSFSAMEHTLVQYLVGDTIDCSHYPAQVGFNYSAGTCWNFPLSINTTVDGVPVSIGTIYVNAGTPEPSTLVLLGMSAFGLLAYGWRRRKAF
jgi:hypothetical protein